jgi:hypothetical protein
MRIWGNPRSTGYDEIILLAPNTKRVNRHHVQWSSRIVKLSIYTDGLGPNSAGIGRLKGIVYDSLGNKLAEGSEVEIPAGMQPSWVDLPIPVAGGVELAAAGYYDFGTLRGGDANVIRAYSFEDFGLGGRSNADAYSDGASDPFGAATTDASQIALFATYVREWAAPSVPDMHLARYGFATAQNEFGRSGVDPKRTRLSLGWHGTALDPERGSFAVVRTGSPATKFLGERVRVTTYIGGKPRSIRAYVHNEAALEEDVDLSLTRPLFLYVGFFSVDNVPAIVEVLA